MSIIYCYKHDKHYDSDYHEDCTECEEELNENQISIIRTAICSVCGCKKDYDEYASCPAHSFGELAS